MLDRQSYDISRMGDENWRLTREVEWLQGKCDAMARSTSWRITRPLRVISYVRQGRTRDLIEAFQRRVSSKALLPQQFINNRPDTPIHPAGPPVAVQEPYVLWMKLNRPCGNRLRTLSQALGIPLFNRKQQAFDKIDPPRIADVSTTRSPIRRLQWHRHRHLDGLHKMDQLIQARFNKMAYPCTIESGFRGNPYLLGYAALGPVLLGFTHWLIQSHGRTPVSAFAFLSRDGYFLQAAYDIVAQAIDGLPPSRYVAASRILCSLSTMDSLERIIEAGAVDHHPMPLGHFLTSRFGFSEDRLQQISESSLKQSGFICLGEIIDQGDARKNKLLKILSPIILNFSAQAAAHYRAYLENQDLDWTTATMVDIGYSGTAQLAIGRLLGTKPTGHYLITSCRASRLDDQELPYASWLEHKVNLDHPFFRNVQLWELFLSATHGSINGIDENTMHPVSDSRVLDRYSRSILSVIRRGALDFVSHFMSEHARSFQRYKFPASACTRTLTKFFDQPAAEDCIYLSHIVFEDRFGGEMKPLILAPGESAIAQRLTEDSVWKSASKVLTGHDPVTPFWPGLAGLLSQNERPPAFLDGMDETGKNPPVSLLIIRNTLTKTDTLCSGICRHPSGF